MRHAKLVTPTTSAQSVFALLKLDLPDLPGTSEILLQASSGNIGDINFGTASQQPGFVVSGGSAALEVGSMKNLYIKGNGTDTLALMVLR